MTCSVLSDSETQGWGEMTGGRSEPRSAKGVSEDAESKDSESWVGGGCWVYMGLGVSRGQSPGVLDRVITVIIDTCQGLALSWTRCPTHCISIVSLPQPCEAGTAIVPIFTQEN